MQSAQAFLLEDGKRLHLQHGPIDLIVEVFGGDRRAAYGRAAQRFETVLEELVAELDVLRQSAHPETQLTGSVARRMQAAVLPLRGQFITPMAAVAGSVADEILSWLCMDADHQKAYVNNGGDVAFHLGTGQTIEAGIAAAAGGRVTITHDMPWRGVATSGWRGRSHSLGIADSVTVVAHSAAAADAAATIIANAVDLPGSPRIERTPARQLAPDSDLGDSLVTVAVDALSPDQIRVALEGGLTCATTLLENGLIGGAVLELQGMVELIGSFPKLSSRLSYNAKLESLHA
ncbi:MAG: UPF0280 family protein [Pseudomonadota bacterium]